MTSADVVDFLNEIENLGIEAWINGGWGVDALLEEQTRNHTDLDIFIHEKDVIKLRGLLEGKGYKEIKLEIVRPHNFVLGDKAGREIDVHVITFDNDGNFIYGPVENGDIYPPATFSGIGVIDGRTIKCISPEWVVKWHTGYKPKEKDFKDVSALCRKFGIEMPEGYKRFNKER
jgi:lincosamide nucleotidyltransferase A/C/D/E